MSYGLNRNLHDDIKNTAPLILDYNSRELNKVRTNARQSKRTTRHLAKNPVLRISLGINGVKILKQAPKTSIFNGDSSLESIDQLANISKSIYQKQVRDIVSQ